MRQMRLSSFSRQSAYLIWLAFSLAAVYGQVFSPLSNAGGQNPPSQKKVRLTGSVVNAVTGEGVSKAKVDIYAGQLISVFTGPDGHFEMENVPEGQWQVMARKPGYFSDQEMARGFFRPKMFRVTESSGDITLKMTPAATITGHVISESGEPLESAQVEVIAGAIENGRRMWQSTVGTQTDDTGEYSIRSSLLPRPRRSKSRRPLHCPHRGPRR